MSDKDSMPDLESALLDRAERLADEYLAKGRDGRDAILKEEQDRLRAREQRIVDDANADADRLYRRRVQAAELRNHGALDRERWRLIESVMDDLPGLLAAIVDDRKTYEPLFRALLASAAESIDDDELIAQVNAHDLATFEDRWEALCKKAVPRKRITLSPEAIECSGGVRVSGHDDRVCVDATFEGRMQRFHDELTQTIAERLFAHSGGASRG